MRVDTGHGDAADRRATLERDNANGLLRDELVNPVTAAVLWTAMFLAVARRAAPDRSPARCRTGSRGSGPLLRWLSLAAIGFVLATMPATLLDLGEHGGKAAFWLFLSVFAVLFAAVCQLVGRRRELDPLFAALALFLAVLVMDQFTGGHLEFNSVFGYSATVGIRFSGIGNQSSALLSTSAVLVASLVALAAPSAMGRTNCALAVLAVSFVALTPPLFGQDFGGTLASAPAFALLGWLLLGRRLTVKAIVTLVGILVASGLVVGFLDLLRPSDQRTHVGRFFEKVGNEGFSGFSTVIERKSGENAASFSSTIYLVLIVVVLAAGVALWLRPPRPLVAAVARVPTLRAAAISLTVLILLSYGLNDSGLAIPAIMLAFIAITATYLVADAPEESPPGASPPATATSGAARATACRPGSGPARPATGSPSFTRRRPRAPGRRGRGRSRRAGRARRRRAARRARPCAPSSCSIVRGPMIGAVTTGLCSSHAERDVGRRLARARRTASPTLELRAQCLDLRLHAARCRAARRPRGRRARRRAARRRAGSTGSRRRRSRSHAGSTSSSTVRALRL